MATSEGRQHIDEGDLVIVFVVRAQQRILDSL